VAAVVVAILVAAVVREGTEPQQDSQLQQHQFQSQSALAAQVDLLILAVDHIGEPLVLIQFFLPLQVLVAVVVVDGQTLPMSHLLLVVQVVVVLHQQEQKQLALLETLVHIHQWKVLQVEMVTPQQPITAVAVVVHQQLVQTLALTLVMVAREQHHLLLEHQLLAQAVVEVVLTLVLAAQLQVAAVQVETLE
jgi:hypothetical protein